MCCPTSESEPVICSHCQDQSKAIQVEAFHVFKVQHQTTSSLSLHTFCCSVVNFYFHWMILKQNACRQQLFVVNKEKPSEITCILHANKNKLLRFLKDFSAVDKGKSEPRLYCFSAFSEPNHVRE